MGWLGLVNSVYSWQTRESSGLLPRTDNRLWQCCLRDVRRRKSRSLILSPGHDPHYQLQSRLQSNPIKSSSLVSVCVYRVPSKCSESCFSKKENPLEIASASAYKLEAFRQRFFIIVCFCLSSELVPDGVVKKSTGSDPDAHQIAI